MQRLSNGQKCRIIRLIRGWDQTKLGDLTQLDRVTISKFERDLPHTGKTLRKIEAAFGHQAGWLASPEVEAAFSILADDAAPADRVRLALALLEDGRRELGQ